MADASPLLELGKESWSLANAITAFAVAQSLALAYALAGESGEKIRTKKKSVAVAIVLAAIAFCFAVWFCNGAHIDLAGIDKAKQGVLADTMRGRMGAIILYTGFGLYMLLFTGKLATQPKPEPVPGS